MFKSINILTSAFICFGIKHLKLKMPMRQGIITPQCWSLTNEIAERLNAQKFINTEVPQKYWNEAVTVIKTHNGGNRSNIAIPNITHEERYLLCLPAVLCADCWLTLRAGQCSGSRTPPAPWPPTQACQITVTISLKIIKMERPVQHVPL